MMDAVEFIKTYSRMCHYYDRLNGSGANPCTGCPLENIGNGCHMLDIADRADEAIAATEQWAKEHPGKTRQSEFLKMYPNAIVMTGGVLCVRPCDVDNTIKKLCKTTNCNVCRRDFWLQEVE